MMSVADVLVVLRNAPKNQPVVIRQVLDEEGKASAERMRSQFVPYPGAGDADGTHDLELLNRRSGGVVGEIRSKVTPGEDKNALEVGVLTANTHTQMVADVQEHGKTIGEPGRRPLMTIPYSIMLNPDGTKRFKTVADARAEYYIWGHGDSLIGRKKGSRDVHGLYALRDTVKIPPRPFVGKDLDTLVVNVVNRLADAVTEVFLA